MHGTSKEFIEATKYDIDCKLKRSGTLTDLSITKMDVNFMDALMTHNDLLRETLYIELMPGDLHERNKPKYKEAKPNRKIGWWYDDNSEATRETDIAHYHEVLDRYKGKVNGIRKIITFLSGVKNTTLKMMNEIFLNNSSLSPQDHEMFNMFKNIV